MDNCRFFDQLTALTNHDAAMRKAVINVLKDCRSTDQPNGNIPPVVKESISKICESYPENDTGHLKETVNKHMSIHVPHHFQPVPPPEFIPLRRAVALSSFVKYHMLASHRGGNLIGSSSAKQTSLPYLKKSLLAQCDENNPVELNYEMLQGATGKPDEPTWWSFYETLTDEPDSGENYMKELALSDSEMKKAMQDNTVIEITLTAEKMKKDLFKPSGLDSFIPNTKFQPELTGRTYGYTVPDEPGLLPRPEMVCGSVKYGDLDNDLILIVKRIAYQQKD